MPGASVLFVRLQFDRSAGIVVVVPMSVKLESVVPLLLPELLLPLPPLEDPLPPLDKAGHWDKSMTICRLGHSIVAVVVSGVCDGVCGFKNRKEGKYRYKTSKVSINLL
jgi:hypothetical protein